MIWICPYIICKRIEDLVMLYVFEIWAVNTSTTIIYLHDINLLCQMSTWSTYKGMSNKTKLCTQLVHTLTLLWLQKRLMWWNVTKSSIRQTTLFACDEHANWNYCARGEPGYEARLCAYMSNLAMIIYKLSVYSPMIGPIRVLYNKSGALLARLLLTRPRVLHKSAWFCLGIKRYLSVNPYDQRWFRVKQLSNVEITRGYCHLCTIFQTKSTAVSLNRFA